MSPEDVTPIAEVELYDQTVLRIDFPEFENDDCEKELEDFHGALKFLALGVALVNRDGDWTRASDDSNFLDDTGWFHLIPHDMNEAFHGGGPPRRFRPPTWVRAAAPISVRRLVSVLHPVVAPDSGHRKGISAKRMTVPWSDSTMLACHCKAVRVRPALRRPDQGCWQALPRIW